MVHENDGAARLCGLCENENMVRSQVKEGKLELTAGTGGLFRVSTVRRKKFPTKHGTENPIITRYNPLKGNSRIPASSGT